MSQPETLGSYHVERELGRGGMGVVYLARDPRLNRLVAIKVIPEALAQNPDNPARFEREAKLLAAVNHPNIGAIYGIEEVQGQRLLILEYVPGDTLSDRLTRGALPVPEALDVARQIAAAIEAAHEGGIVHRDLKPGNVKVTPEGLVKVLDFGLAKGGSASSGDLAQSPTLTYSPTAIGVILGTAGYMSPEQARGKPVDRRADIWAFACVLYECLTGRKVFEGETVSDTIARIIEREPDFDALPPATPLAVRELLRRCLEKDIRKRQRDIGDVRIELESALARSSASVVMQAPAAHAARSVWSRWAVPALFAIVGAAAGIAVWTMARPASSTTSSETVSLSIEVPSTFRPVTFAFGLDGKSVIGLGNPMRSDGTEDPQARLYVRQLAGFDFTPIPGTEGVTVFTLSPDGKSVAVVRPVSDQSSDSVLVTVPIDGSSPAFKIADWGRDWSDQEDLQWLRDGDILIQTSQRTKFLRLPSGGGPAKPPVAFDIGQAPGYPVFAEELPDGRGVLIRMEGWGAQGYQQDICVLDANTGKITRLIENAARPHFDESTRTLFFARGSTLMAVPFDPSTYKVGSDQVPLFDGLRSNSWNHGRISISPAGHLLFEPGGRLGLDRRIVAVNAAREVTPFIAEARSFEASLSLSRDGKQIAVVIPNSRGTYETWTASVDRPNLRRVLALPNADCAGAAWSPTAEWLAFNRNGRDKDDGVYVQRSDGSGEAKAVYRIGSMEEAVGVTGWMADGSGVLVTKFTAGKTELLMVPVSPDGVASPPKAMRESKSSLSGALASPDGKLVLFKSDESGRSELYVAGLSGGRITGQPLPIDASNVDGYQWGPDGKRIYIRQGPRRLMTSAIEGNPVLRASTPVQAYDFKSLRLEPTVWEILPGDRLIGLQLGAGEGDLPSYGVVLNWVDSIRARLSKK